MPKSTSPKPWAIREAPVSPISSAVTHCCWALLSQGQLSVTPRTPAGSSVHGSSQARTLEWVAIPSPEDLPDPGIESMSLVSLALAGGFFFFNHCATWEAQWHSNSLIFPYCSSLCLHDYHSYIFKIKAFFYSPALIYFLEYMPYLQTDGSI